MEADTAVNRAEDAERKNKQFEQMILEKDQEIKSLNIQLGTVSHDLEKAEGKLAESKASAEVGEHSKTTSETLARKVQLLEEELDVAEKNVKETVEK